MRNTGIFHPQFFYHPRPVVESAMIVDVKIYEPTGEQSNWEPGITIPEQNNLYTLRYIGKARIQPNKDWRARTREQGLEFAATQAVRVQLGINSNQYFQGPADSHIPHADASEDFRKDWMVEIDEAYVTGTEWLEGNLLYVRNAIKSGNAWVHNLLCDTNTKE